MTTLKELKEAVDYACEQTTRNRANSPEETKVVIPVFRTNGVGWTSAVEVKGAYLGFDWNAGRFMITPASELREIGRDEVKSLLEHYDKESWAIYTKQQLNKEIKKLKKRIEELEGQIISIQSDPIKC